MIKKTLFWVGLYSLFLGFLMLGDSPWGRISTVAILAITIGPLVFIGFLQLCFFVYAWMMHGTPFHEEACICHPGLSHISIATPKKRQKYCPLCKRESLCRVTFAKGLGRYVHVVRG